MTAGGGLSAGVEEAPAPRKRRISPMTYVLIAAGAFVVIALIRTLTGAEDLTSSGTVAAALTAAVPIALAGLGGLWSERAGVINIGLEGMMVLGTFGAGLAGWQWGPWAGVFFGVVLGAVGGLIHAVATVTFGVDHIISGVAITLVAPGLTLFLAKLYFTDTPGGGQKKSPPIPDVPRVSIPGFSSLLGDIEAKHWFLISDLAGVLRGLTTNVSLLTLLAVVLFVFTAWLLWRTPFGLRLRSCGEAPVAAESLGVNVYKYKYAAIVSSGALAGLGGAILAVSSSQFRDQQVAGRGYIGLASMIFGNWRPGGVAAGAGLFGYTDAMQLRGADAVHALLLLLGIALLVLAVFQARARRYGIAGVAAAIGVAFLIWFASTDVLPPELVTAAPYVVTLLVLSLAAQRLRVPKWIGQSYRKGQGG
ncbi:simple sugar transport system permease protein [Herbihabitans rhizosphaerae]|uniref:Simple sugar transport system permease protein n=1 Tax=Herbihabitans rhizosphaerae TaxID=1872711 RepID=A0A4Q7KKX1_9PSEU|nr:ABC transporter permease [Herbihabitans rhizosphaerae]RZS36864.1 simple sugar transport system permease protein [Herbihabitans rhizosphaerae]